MDGAHAHVVPLLGLHLQGLDRRDAVLGIKHQDFGPVHILEPLQGGLAGVPGGGHQDAHGFVLLILDQRGREQMGQDLQGHILEGRSGAMPQLQAIGILRQGFQRRHPGIVKLFPRVAGLGKGRQLLLGEILQKQLHHRHGPLAVGLAPQVLQQGGGELGEDLRGQQAAVPGQALGDGLAGAQANRLISCADILHVIHIPFQRQCRAPCSGRAKTILWTPAPQRRALPSKHALPVADHRLAGALSLGRVNLHHVKPRLQRGGMFH